MRRANDSNDDDDVDGGQGHMGGGDGEEDKKMKMKKRGRKAKPTTSSCLLESQSQSQSQITVDATKSDGGEGALVDERLLVLPLPQFRSLLKEKGSELSVREMDVLRRERRRLLNRSYQQRSRSRKAAKLVEADEVVEAHEQYAAQVRALATTHLAGSSCDQSPPVQAFLCALTQLEAHFAVGAGKCGEE